MPRRPAPRRLAAVPLAALLAGLLAPALSAPAHAAPLPAPAPLTTADPDRQKVVELRWAPVPGAVSYAVQVSTDPYWSDEADLFSLSTVSSQLTLPVWLPHADYVWRVASVGADGVRGPWSATMDELTEEPLADVTFTRGWGDVPLLQEQVPGDEYFPTFRWSPVRTASEYQIQVTDDPTLFDHGQHEQMRGSTGSCFTTRTTMTPFNKQKSAPNSGVGNCWFEGLDTAPQLFWRVRALDAVAGEVTELVTKPVVSSGISTLPPAPPGELDTSDCPEASGEVVAACEPVHAVEKGDWSALQVWERQAPWPSVQDDYRELPQVTTAPLPDDLCTPTGLCRDVPTIDWDEVPGATFYRTYVALDRQFTNVQEIAETPATTYTPTVQWRDSGVNASYYYAVQACTSDGCGPVTTSPPAFRKGSAPVRLQGEEIRRTDTVLRWDDYASVLAELGDAASEAAAYRVQVTRATDTSFAAPLEDVVTDHTSHASTSMRYAEGDYLWRVQAIDASGHRLRWSTPRPFTRDFTAPVVRSTSTLTSLDPRANVTVVMSERVQGVSASTAQLVPTYGGPAVLAAVTLSGSTITIDPASTLPAGGAYSLQLTGDIEDLAGNPLVPWKRSISVNPVLDDASTAFSYAGSWSTPASSMVSSGRYHLSSAAGATATTSLFGTGVRVYGCKGPTGGKFELRVDGVLKKTVDTYQSYSSCGTLTEVFDQKRGLHTVQIKVTGTRSTASKGTGVGLDGVRALL